jgi:peptide-methionine (S)-S-oxide reductase
MTVKKATFGAGCFWGVEQAFRKLSGVVDVKVGYMGGHVKNPSYEQVCTNSTGHAEVAQITFNPDKVSYEELLAVFWNIHDPTQYHRQGPDIGSQYRSAIFYHSEHQKEMALQSKQKLQDSQRFSKDIVTEIVPVSDFYLAEEYHQRYFEKSGIKGCSIGH